MKKLLLIALVVLSGCVEEVVNTDQPSNSTPPPVAPPYTREIINITDLPSFDSSYWSYTQMNSPTYTVSGTSVSYSSNSNGYIDVQSKFKILGDSDGAFTLNAEILFGANSPSLIQGVMLNFGAGDNYGFIEIVQAVNPSSQVYYIIRYTDDTRTVYNLDSRILGMNNTDTVTPVSLERNSAGVITLTIDGNVYQINQNILKQDMDIFASMTNTGYGAIQNVSVTTSQFANFEGR